MESKIDVHSHFLPSFYRQAIQSVGDGRLDGLSNIPEWSEESHLHLMKTLNIEKSIISISSPGTRLLVGEDEQAQSLTHKCNQTAADLKQRMPEKFGFWASLPLPNVQDSLAELSRAMDELCADGIALLTNYNGRYLGDKQFDPVFEELNDRKAIVFLHPTGGCTASGERAPLLEDIPPPVFEYYFDTARALINLFLSGTIARCPHITFIISHCGGAFPPLITRFSATASALGIGSQDVDPDTVRKALNKQFFFDTASHSIPDQITGLLQHVDTDRFLYGSDYPFTPLSAVESFAKDHEKYLPDILSDVKDRKALYRENARRLLARERRG